ncbi:hypothetical protein J1614_001562 [Plenodomus biglobosus]|nr:hypothetical protein J1614_001562 [Plenodomus biglobosus]
MLTVTPHCGVITTDMSTVGDQLLMASPKPNQKRSRDACSNPVRGKRQKLSSRAHADACSTLLQTSPPRTPSESEQSDSEPDIESSLPMTQLHDRSSSPCDSSSTASEDGTSKDKFKTVDSTSNTLPLTSSQKPDTPALYLRFLVNKRGESPTPSELLRIASVVRAYAMGIDDDGARAIDSALQRNQEAQGSDIYHYMKGSKERAKKVVTWCKAIVAICEDTPPEKWDEPLLRPLTYCGYAKQVSRRSKQYDNYQSTTWLVLLVQAALTVYFPSACYSFATYPVCFLARKDEAALGERALTRCTYSDYRYGGFCVASAGSCSSAENVGWEARLRWRMVDNEATAINLRSQEVYINPEAEHSFLQEQKRVMGARSQATMVPVVEEKLRAMHLRVGSGAAKDDEASSESVSHSSMSVCVDHASAVRLLTPPTRSPFTLHLFTTIAVHPIEHGQHSNAPRQGTSSEQKGPQVSLEDPKTLETVMAQESNVLDTAPHPNQGVSEQPTNIIESEASDIGLESLTTSRVDAHTMPGSSMNFPQPTGAKPRHVTSEHSGTEPEPTTPSDTTPKSEPLNDGHTSPAHKPIDKGKSVALAPLHRGWVDASDIDPRFVVPPHTYGCTVAKSLALCKDTFESCHGCPRGAGCPARHHWLNEEEQAAVKMARGGVRLREVWKRQGSLGVQGISNRDDDGKLHGQLGVSGADADNGRFHTPRFIHTSNHIFKTEDLSLGIDIGIRPLRVQSPRS